MQQSGKVQASRQRYGVRLHATATRAKVPMSPTDFTSCTSSHGTRRAHAVVPCCGGQGLHAVVDPAFFEEVRVFFGCFLFFFFFFCKRGCTSIWAETSHNLCSVALGHVFPAAIKRTYAGVSESTPPHSPHIYSRSDYYRADKLEQTDAKELARAGAEATGGKKICCTPRILILCEALDKWAVLRDTRHEYFPCSLRIKILFLGGFLGRCRVGWLSENSTEKKSRKHISLRSTRRAPKAGM